MSLIPVDAEYHYVQDTAPDIANAGDVWLDTSVNPPVAKIYADVGNGLEWIQDQSSDRIETHLDAPVSEAGSAKTPTDYLYGTFDGDIAASESEVLVSGTTDTEILSGIIQFDPANTDMSSIEPRFKANGTDLFVDDGVFENFELIGTRPVMREDDNGNIKFDIPRATVSSFEFAVDNVAGSSRICKVEVGVFIA